MSIPVVIGADGHGNPTYDFIAVGPKGQTAWINVWNFAQASDYNAAGGTLDAGLMINRAVAFGIQNYANGFVVYLPTGFYPLATGIVLSADNMTLQGDGLGTVLQPITGSTFDVISTPIPPSAGTPGFFRNHCSVQDLTIDCSRMAGTVAGQGNAIHLYGAVHCAVRRVHVKTCKNYAFLLDGDNTNFGYNNAIVENYTDSDCAGGVLAVNNEANFITRNAFSGCGGATGCAALQPAFTPQSQEGDTMYLISGVNLVMDNIFGNGGPTLTFAVHLQNTQNKLTGNKFDGCQYQALRLDGSYHMVVGNEFTNVASAGSGVPGVQIGGNGMRLVANTFRAPSGNAKYTYAIIESGGPFVDSVIADNFFQAGTTGVINPNAASTLRIHHNSGYNPRGASVTQPAVPASATPLTNTTGVDVTVIIATLGGLTAVSIGGTAVTAAPAAGSSYRIPAGQTITLTWATTAPTWQWFGD